MKHVSLLSCCAGFNPSRTAKLLHSKGFLTTPVFNLFKSIQSRQDSAEALLPTLVSLSDSAVCYFVLEALPEMGLEEIALSLQQCPGDAACPLQSGQCHGIQVSMMTSICYAKYPLLRIVSLSVADGLVTDICVTSHIFE